MRSGHEKGVRRRTRDATDDRRFHMGIGDKASNKGEDLGGKAKEATGKVTGDQDL